MDSECSIRLQDLYHVMVASISRCLNSFATTEVAGNWTQTSFSRYRINCTSVSLLLKFLAPTLQHQRCYAQTATTNQRYQHSMSIPLLLRCLVCCRRYADRFQRNLPSSSTTAIMSHESVWYSRPRGYGKGARAWYEILTTYTFLHRIHVSILHPPCLPHSSPES